MKHEIISKQNSMSKFIHTYPELLTFEMYLSLTVLTKNLKCHGEDKGLLLLA